MSDFYECLWIFQKLSTPPAEWVLLEFTCITASHQLLVDAFHHQMRLVIWKHYERNYFIRFIPYVMEANAEIAR